jgi:hypothetical protein
MRKNRGTSRNAVTKCGRMIEPGSHARPGNGATTITTCWRTASWSAASSASMQSGRRAAPGCGRAATTATSNGRPTAMSRRARPRWRHSRRAGDASNALANRGGVEVLGGWSAVRPRVTSDVGHGGCPSLCRVADSCRSVFMSRHKPGLLSGITRGGRASGPVRPRKARRARRCTGPRSSDGVGGRHDGSRLPVKAIFHSDGGRRT